MIEQILKNAPDSWEVVELNEVGVINPKIEKSLYEDDKVCSFVPMPAVEAESGRIDVTETRLFNQVKKGFTPFFERDVLFAKITPCMENGKVAVVPKLIGDLGFGSTEFHVVRPYSCISESYLFYYLVSQIFRYEAERNMTGAVGQRRVPAPWLSSVKIPLPPQKEQQRIVEKLEELFSELDSGIESLRKAKKQLTSYRQALLKQAFEGKLTAQWREDNSDKLESPDDILERLKRERDERYQQKLDEWEVTVNQWEQDGSKGKKPSKPRKPKAVTPFVDLPDFCQELPDSWFWDKLGHMTLAVEYGTSAKSSESGRVPVLRMGNIQNTKFDWDDLVFTSDEDEISKYTLNGGDVLFNRTNSPELVGKTAKYNGEREALFAGYLIRVNHFDNFVNSDYLNLFLNSYVSKRYGNTVKTDGVNQSNINGEKLSNYPFPYCSLAEQEQVIQILEEKISKIERSESEITMNLKKAELLRQSILKKAFSGKLVSQDTEDEPANELLKKIAIEKEELAEKEKAEKAAARKKKATAKKTVKS
ncbi:restriction endonuclease subunit S [Photobacterium sp. DA100]|uniref:restriction endonuclease subunit S n=1 Tax=Photobacterium sp. DA100 TaxID=3027472 RepID=UPI00247B11E9|nr:restriction endonuclease subunit S [Photobacterium sp. DA100]WEM40999.1 restriction endonuclease subunit S [Photobacterium sp. DA100]